MSENGVWERFHGAGLKNTASHLRHPAKAKGFRFPLPNNSETEAIPIIVNDKAVSLFTSDKDWPKSLPSVSFLLAPVALELGFIKHRLHHRFANRLDHFRWKPYSIYFELACSGIGQGSKRRVQFGGHHCSDRFRKC